MDDESRRPVVEQELAPDRAWCSFHCDLATGDTRRHTIVVTFQPKTLIATGIHSQCARLPNSEAAARLGGYTCWEAVNELRRALEGRSDARSMLFRGWNFVQAAAEKRQARADRRAIDVAVERGYGFKNRVDAWLTARARRACDYIGSIEVSALGGHVDAVVYAPFVWYRFDRIDGWLHMKGTENCAVWKALWDYIGPSQIEFALRSAVTVQQDGASSPWWTDEGNKIDALVRRAQILVRQGVLP